MRTTAATTMLSLLCLPAIAHADDWSALRRDPTGSRASSESAGASFSAKWTYTAKHGGHLIASPLSVSGLVIAAGTEGDLAALDVADGHERWARVLDSGVGSTPAAYHGRLVTSTFGGQLYSLDLVSGAVNWQRPFGGSMNYSSPVVIDDANGGPGSVVLPAGAPSKDVSRIDLATGAAQWSTEDGAIVDLMYTSAAVVGQQAIVGMNGGRYQSLDLQTGATRWMFNAVGPVNFSSPLVLGDTVYMFPGDSKSQLFAARLDNGQAISGFPLAIPDPAPVTGSSGMLGRGPATSPPMTAGGLILFQMRRQDMLNNPDRTFKVVMREYVVAVDPKLLKIVWQHPVANVTAANVNGVPELNTCPTPAAFMGASGPMIAVSSSISARVAVLDVATGEERWSAPLSGPGRSSPIFTNGLLLVGTDAGVLHAFSSDSNCAPRAPSGLVATADSASGNVTLAWNAASDPEGQALSYVVRVIESGDAATRTSTETAPGQTTLSLAAFKPGVRYQVSVRARDSQRALSSWSDSPTFEGGAPLPSTKFGSTDVVLSGTVPPTMPPSAPPSGMMPPACAPPTMPAGAPATTATEAQPASPIVTIFAEPSAAPSDAMSPTSVQPAVESAPVAAAMPATASTVLGLAHAPSDVEDNSLASRDALAGGCSVAGTGTPGAAACALALALMSVVLRNRKRNANRA